MKTNENSVDKSTIVIATALLLSFAFPLVMLIVQIFFTDVQVHLQCEKSQPAETYCQLTRRKLFREKKQTLVSGELKGAIIDTYTDEAENSYKILLETQKDRIPFGISTSWIGDKKKKVNQINDFVEDSNITLLDVKQNDTIAFVLDLIRWGCWSITYGLIPIAFLCSMLLKIISKIRARLGSMLNHMNKPPKKALFSLEKKPQG